MTEQEQRELHHFETEQALSNIHAYLLNLEDWEIEGHALNDLLEMIPEDVRL